MSDPTLPALAGELNLRAGGFIVTLYGDVVAPRGGELWMGDVIAICESVGIQESRVRTAVSRLVSGGTLEGVKSGRKSFYRLTPAGQAEFARAAALIYRPPIPAPLKGWRLVPLPQGPERETLVDALAEARFGFPSPGLAMLPDYGGAAPEIAAASFLASSDDDLRDLVDAAWPLEDLAERIEAFITAMAPLERRRLADEDALAARLLLVHGFRDIALVDPRLPLAASPEGWRGEEARALFARLYLSLSTAADAVAAARLVSRTGPLAPDASTLRRRRAALGGG